MAFKNNKPTLMTKLYTEHVVAIPPPPPRFSITEWYLNNRIRYRTCDDQQALADKVLAESDRLREETDELAKLNKREVDHHLEQKLQDINFMKDEIDKQRKEVVKEMDNLTLYADRISDATRCIDECDNICKKCIIMREGRLGIDLCHDDVERELLKEQDVIAGVKALLTRDLQQSNEQLRRLRMTVYFMDRDLEDKTNVLKIDEHNKELREDSLNLSMYHGFSPLDPASITAEEWEQFSRMSIENGAKEINSTRLLRSYVDTIINQAMADLKNQYYVVNDAFRRRIEETKECKTKMEIQHSEVVRQVNEMTRTLTRLQKSIAEKEGFMALAHTRLGNRAQRPGMELCRDLVETHLVNEVKELKSNLSRIQQMIAEAQASLRYLLKTQIQLEEDINIKTNTLKIDEVDCLTLRQSMNYQAY